MTRIAVTGANGQLGRLAVRALSDRADDSTKIVALTRDPSQVEDLAALGAEVREADFDRPETLGPALSGVEKVLLVSTMGGNRVEQHGNLIEAAKAAGVKLIAYTSVLHADTTSMLLAHDHRATEEALKASGIPYVFLRNSWYSENYTFDLAGALAQGALTGAAGGGKASVAARKDYAEAAAVVLSTDGHENKAYELGGEPSMTMVEIAAALSKATGREIPYNNVRSSELEEIMAGAGLPGEVAKVFADADEATGRGDLETDSGDLIRLIGRPTTPFEETAREAAAAL
jgi:NAD(P)H dehydrogenase (quinone)